jgi:hypothetical protein
MYYRLYLMRGGRFRDAIDFHAANDAEALAEAEQQAEGSPAELWCRARRIASLSAAAA